MKRYAVYGAEGFAREVLPVLRQQTGAEESDIVLIDDNPQLQGDVIHGCKVHSFQELCEPAHNDRELSVAIADPKIREKVVRRCEDAGLRFVDIVDRTHIRYENVDVGPGGIFCANTVLTGDLTIGKHFHANIFSYVAHDCLIGDFVTFAPRVSCNGRVHIGDYAYVGTGVQIRQGTDDNPLRIGAGAVIGMGSVVLHDVPDGAVVVGNPAKPLVRS